MGTCPYITTERPNDSEGVHLGSTVFSTLSQTIPGHPLFKNGKSSLPNSQEGLNYQS